ncbi:MAG: hypothetical protein MUD01_09120 [Chloroflexaceae bacterium]|nr:hypothetical protein [Chloroflexaceae bacterium]
MRPFRRRLTTLFTLLTCVLLLLGNSAQAAPRPAQVQQPTPPPKGIAIPLGSVPEKIDGNCSDFGDALVQPFDDTGGTIGRVYLKYNGDHLYVCMQGAKGSKIDRFGAVYLDPDGSGAALAQKNDYALEVVPIPGQTKRTRQGKGTGDYDPSPNFDPVWNGVATTNETSDVVEYDILYNRFDVSPCKFRMAVYHLWPVAQAVDYGWPSNQFYDRPVTWKQVYLDAPQCRPAQESGKIAYVYRGNAADANSFKALLEGAGYSVTLVPIPTILATDFAQFDLTIIADDSGDLGTWSWGSAAVTADRVAKILLPNKPVLGLGEGGYSFFGEIPSFIGWPNGWHGPNDSVKRPPLVTTTHYNGVAGDPVKLYTTAVNEVGIYLGAPGSVLPSDVLVVGLEPTSPTHASNIRQGCRELWGFSGNPTVMTADGQKVFLNAVAYNIRFQCQPVPPPTPQCKVEKTANPAGGTAVAPGTVIEYTITYTNCKDRRGKLVDSVPIDTTLVPNSITGGGALAADGSVQWDVGALASGSVKFRVLVYDTVCNKNPRQISNRAGLLIPGEAPVVSNVVTHPVTCPPITMPNDEPPYAEQEVSIHPYPLVTGTASTIKVRLTNSSSTPQPVKVSFQTSPQRFGIGITFSDFDVKTVVIPANSSVIVSSSFTPVSSGHYCISIKIEDNSGANPPRYKPIFTYRNLDVTENLRPGVPDDLVFKVANPKPSVQNINLTVVNTCPGWTAVVIPTTLTNVGPNGSDVRDVTLRVTPPNPVSLGSGCHIDVQGWIGDELIGGIRKLDVPPVHLPPDVNPPWLEPEISTIPSPPVVGQPAQICVQLQNPLTTAKTVSLDFAVADFGAGIGFTPVGSLTNVTLPPLSNANYCITWTPTASNNLHRCILVTLKQPGYRDMRSQLNIDLRRIRITDIQSLLNLDIPINIGNPTGVPQPLRFRLQPYGIDPRYVPIIVGPGGGDPPPELNPGQTVQLRLRFRPAAAGASVADVETQQAPANFLFGDESRVDVGVFLGDREESGFTIRFEAPRIFLPVVSR